MYLSFIILNNGFQRTEILDILQKDFFIQLIRGSTCTAVYMVVLNWMKMFNKKCVTSFDHFEEIDKFFKNNMKTW